METHRAGKAKNDYVINILQLQNGYWYNGNSLGE